MILQHLPAVRLERVQIGIGGIHDVAERVISAVHVFIEVQCERGVVRSLKHKAAIETTRKQQIQRRRRRLSVDVARIADSRRPELRLGARLVSGG